MAARHSDECTYGHAAVAAQLQAQTATHMLRHSVASHAPCLHTSSQDSFVAASRPAFCDANRLAVDAAEQACSSQGADLMVWRM